VAVEESFGHEILGQLILFQPQLDWICLWAKVFGTGCQFSVEIIIRKSIEQFSGPAHPTSISTNVKVKLAE
jgi:hypothetical protein